ncbi:tyrosine-protein kinase receptor Tie-2 [Megalops cyprinoides]|uniref:tyrosine-protein kinase receptor Tie-2 n=1 Tax=Megalops cyprinoides TaxID=118141 RepID=UPI001864A540|nr:tyrosine-protein kinase receptor Tie-2 [Megalops cyprinoides]
MGYFSLILHFVCWLVSARSLDIADLTLVNTEPVSVSAESSLLCVSGDWSASDAISMGREYPLLHLQSPPVTADKNYRATSKITWKTRNVDIFGAFYCKIQNADSAGKLYTVRMLNEAVFHPESLTVMASIGDVINITFNRRKIVAEDAVIYKNGDFIHSIPSYEIQDTLQYVIKEVKMQDSGLYTVRYIAGTPNSSAITRLIVRNCSAGFWGKDCSQTCPPCSNGGVCHDETGECICPPGFKGQTCEIVCGEGRFGRTCKNRCRFGSCRSMVFCLRDPYGCSCASGWWGLNCSEACPQGFYGAGCKLRCECGGRGKCDRFRGCVCPGRHGSRCERAEQAPVVISDLRDTELNSGVNYTVNCTAQGYPPPMHGQIVLITPGKTEVYAMDTETVENGSTSQFKVDKITLHETGRWLCQVKTSAGQAEKDFIVHVKVPPKPQYPPTLNSSGPYHLTVWVNKDPYTGDGPETSVKIFYKRVNTTSWETIEVTGPLVKLENLTPCTQYTMFVQLSRHGAGGVGFPGPEASFSTLVLDLPLPTGITLIPLSQTSLSLTWDLVKGHVNEHWSYQVECLQSYEPENIQTHHLPRNSTGLKLTSLKPKQKYECKVRIMTSSVGQYCRPVSAWTLSNELPPPPFNIMHCNITDSSAVLIWSLEEGNSISKVNIRFQDTDLADYSQQAEINVQEHQAMQFQLRGLRANTSYLVEMWATNNIGKSLNNPQIQIKTMPPQESSRLYGFGSEGNMLFFAILGSAGMTCVTILLAFCIVLQLKRATFQRRMVQAFQNIVREEPVVQFNSGSLNMTKKSKNSAQPVAYPALEWNDIKFQDVIGEGNFGQVLKARIKKDGLRMDAAIKRMKEYASKDDHRDFAGELEVLCKLGHHPNIINLLGACEHRGYLYLAIEYAPHGNLLDFLRKSRVLETDPAFAIANSTASTLSSQQLLHFAADVARGMDYLSQKQFIHRDLAARNILVGENYVAKIADFGLSRGQEVYVKKTMGRLPVRWMAIESLNYSVYTTNSDVWSYGVLLWEVVSLGGTPYCGMTCAELYEKLPQGYRLEKPLNCDDEVYDLMRQCWRERPYERPSFAQILMSLNRMLEERKTYVNTTLYEKFTYAGIDCSAEEAG